MSDIELLKKELSETVSHFIDETKKIRASGISPELVEEVQVLAYRAKQPLKNLASVTKVSENEVTISVWDATVRKDVISALSTSNLGVNPQDNGNSIRLISPPPTMERRTVLVKNLKEKKEEAKISLRSHRKNFLQHIDEKSLAEDELKRLKVSVDKAVKDSEDAVDQRSKEKESELLGK